MWFLWVPRYPLCKFSANFLDGHCVILFDTIELVKQLKSAVQLKCIKAGLHRYSTMDSVNQIMREMFIKILLSRLTDIFTFKAKDGKQYYSNCYMEGAVDYIFGNAAAWFVSFNQESSRLIP